jgi:Flp pilus assembly protein TadD
MDFGIARIADTRTTTPTGMVMGTIEYMSPEQVKGEELDGRSDQFALAAVAYRMLTGTTVFGQHTLATLAYKIVNETPPTVRMRNAALPASVDAVVSKALSKLPQERYGTCGEFVEALAASLAEPRREETTLPMPLPHGVAAAAVPMPAPVPAPAPARKSHRGAIAIAAVLLLAAAGLAVWRPWNRAAETPSVSKTTAEKAAPALPPAPTATATHGEVPRPSKPPAASTTSAKPAESSPATPAAAKQAPPTPAESTKEIPLAVLPEEPPPSLDKPVAEPAPAQTPQPAMDAYKLGMDLFNRQQFAAAVDSFTRAVALRPDWPNPLLDRGRAYQRQGDCLAAIRDFDQFLKARPKNPFAHTYRGQCYVRLKDDNRALDDFNAAITLKPNALLALYGRAMLHMRRSSYAAAINDFNEAIRDSPKYEAAYLGRGNAKLKMGDRAGAQADFKMAEDLKGK